MPPSNPVSHERDALLGKGMSTSPTPTSINELQLRYLKREHLKALKERKSEIESQTSVLRTLTRPIGENRKNKEELKQLKQEIREIENNMWKPSTLKYRRLARRYKMKGLDVSKWGTDAARYLGGSSR